jgi:hypothetical protein
LITRTANSTTRAARFTCSYLFNTCNTWTARMLRAGGVNLSPSGVVTADDLVARLRAAVSLDRRSGGGA